MDNQLIMFYNVENLFLSDDNQSTTKPSGLHNWTNYKYQLKIKKIGNVFRFINDDYGQIPSIIGLAEIGNKSVLEDIISQNTELVNYKIIHQQSTDSRGLSNSLLFDSSKITLIDSDFISFRNNADKPFETRDIIKARFIINDKKLSIFVVHLPSKRQQDVKKKMRETILKGLKQELEQSLKNNEEIILMGDFNENPTSQNLLDLIINENGNPILENPFIEFFKNNQFTTFHGKQGSGFDQILYSKHLGVEIGFKKISAKIYDNQKLKVKNSKHPIRTYSGSRYIGGYSDHFPVLLELEK